MLTYAELLQVHDVLRLDCAADAFIGENPHDSADTQSVGTPQQQIMCCEEMLRRLLSVLSAREWAGDMTALERWRMCLIHCLALQERAHSELVEWAETCSACTGMIDPQSLTQVSKKNFLKFFFAYFFFEGHAMLCVVISYIHMYICFSCSLASLVGGWVGGWVGVCVCVMYTHALLLHYSCFTRYLAFSPA
jgi:hypothetical protein